MESRNIAIEDLRFLEEDLMPDELVSIAFLLFGTERPKWVLEKLREKQLEISLLQDYANYHDNWKSTIIEALGTVKAFECIENLGIPIPMAREFVRKSSLINPGLKLLYQLCEACPKTLNDQLINFIKDECDSSTLTVDDQLELHLLYAITENKIKVTPAGCDLSLIKKFENNTTIEDPTVLELLKKFPSKLNTLDTSANNDFNSTNREQNVLNTKSDQNEVQALTNPLDNYRTKKMFALIINQQHFRKTTNIELMNLLPKEILTERNGTAKDMEALKKVFDDFKYHVIVKNDLTHVEIIKEVDKASKQSSKYDGLIVCVLSHGHEGLFYGSDSVPVFIRDIKENMSSKVLLNKPKILLIQACQGDNLQPTVKKIIQTELDGPNQSNLISGSTRADFLTFWSTIEGFASVRHVENGSWFIQELVKKITELYKSQHLMDICTSVINEVSMKRGYRDQCMLPKLESTFTKNFRFPSSIDHSEFNCLNQPEH